MLISSSPASKVLTCRARAAQSKNGRPNRTSSAQTGRFSRTELFVGRRKPLAGWRYKPGRFSTLPAIPATISRSSMKAAACSGREISSAMWRSPLSVRASWPFWEPWRSSQHSKYTAIIPGHGSPTCDQVEARKRVAEDLKYLQILRAAVECGP